MNQCMTEPGAALEAMVDGAFNLFERCVKSRVRKIVMVRFMARPRAFATTEPHSPLANRTL